MQPDRVRPHAIRRYGWKAGRPNHDSRFMVVGPKVVPPAVDLRPFCSPIMDQGELGSCTANGTTAAMLLLLRKRGQPISLLSRMQLYYDGRLIEGTVLEDAGAVIEDVIRSATKLGVGLETLWPYVIERFAQRPPAAVYRSALTFQVLASQRVPVSVYGLKAALAMGYPVVFGVTVYESFESDEVAATGAVPTPRRGEQEVGGHCMLAVGYGQKPGTFTVQNSWGTGWGDRGFCYIPESYIGSEAYGADYWSITDVEDGSGLSPPPAPAVPTVLTIQTALRARGFDTGPLDGISGWRTRTAIIAFQRANGLDPDGIVGPLTAAALGLPYPNEA